MNKVRDGRYFGRAIVEFIAALIILVVLVEVGLPIVGLIAFIAMRIYTRIKISKDYNKEEEKY